MQQKFWLEFDDQVLQKHTGLDFSIAKSGGEVKFEVHSLWPVRRQRPDGTVLNQVIFSILQHRPVDLPVPGKKCQEIWGGCTFIADLDSETISYLISKPLFQQDQVEGRVILARNSLNNPQTTSLAATYGMAGENEPFAMLHAGL